jgi:hypothetical protein
MFLRLRTCFVCVGKIFAASLVQVSDAYFDAVDGEGKPAEMWALTNLSEGTIGNHAFCHTHNDKASEA